MITEQAMERDPTLGFQHDIYQRYAFLSRLVEAVLSTGGSEGIPPARLAVRVLDVGSGPTHLTETFLPAGVEIVRADIDQFGDETIVKLTPGGPLPFLDQSFDLVLALDVLEHMPQEERPALIGECLRVARRAVILCCPVAHPETSEAESQFLAGARAVSGHTVEFLIEHARFGLPAAADVERALASPGWHVVAVDNSPLDEWLVFNLADFIYSCDFGDGPEKRALNAAVNRQAYFLRPDTTHYRRFFCGFRDPRDQQAVERVVGQERARFAPPSLPLLAAGAGRVLVSLRQDLGQASAARAADMREQLTALAHTNDSLSHRLEDQTSAYQRQLMQVQEQADAARQQLALLEGMAQDLRQRVEWLQSADQLAQQAQQRQLAEREDAQQQVAQTRQLLATTEAHVTKLERALTEAYAQVRALDTIVSGRAGQIAMALRRWRELWFPSTSWQFRLLDRMLRSLGWRSRSLFDPGPLAGDALPAREYQTWLARHTPSPADLERQRQAVLTFTYCPLISIITPAYNTPVGALRAMLDSVLAQTYPHWELCLVDGGSTVSSVPGILQDYAGRDTRLRVRRLPSNRGISGNSNAALEMAQGEFVALLDHDDVLEPYALFAVTQSLNRQPETDVLYSDHDILSADGKVASHPVFKPAWSPETMLSANYLTHLTVLRTALVRDVGGFAPDTDGAQDWDLFLRVAEKASRIVHLPLVLYHWRNSAGSTARDIRAKPQVPQTQLRVIERHLARHGLTNPRARFDTSGFIRVDWTYDRERLVSIVIPSRGTNTLLESCIHSILTRTAYPCLEIVVVNNGPQPPAAFPYYEKVTRDPRVRVVHDERPFNYSAANNLGARHAKGDLLLFLNNDTEVMAPDWLDELAMWAARPAVGLVGAKLLFPNGSIQHAGVVLGLTGFAGHLFAGATEGQESCFGWAEWYRNFLAVTAACLLTRRDVFEHLGGFDEEFALCGSDVALGLRAHDLGYRVVYNPFARVRHHESATHRGTIPPEDFKVSLRRYRPWLERGDPYFNANLSYWQTVPALSQPDEPDQLTFAAQYVAALGASHAAP